MDLFNIPFFRSYEADLGWLMRTVKKWDLKLKEFFEGDGIRDFIEGILVDHPEWVTTVMDGAINESKIYPAFLKVIKNQYVTPEMFGAKGDGVTDDTAAVQAAINSVLESYNGGTVVLVGTYKLADPVNLTKGNTIPETPITRKTLSFIALHGGGFYKNNQGYMFTAQNQSSDFSFINVRFSGGRGINDVLDCSVFDCSKLIRIRTVNCHFSNLNYVYDDRNTIDTNTNMQSNRSVNDTYTMCNAVYYIRRLYDCVLSGATIEDCNAGVQVDTSFANVNVNTLTINDSCIESTSMAIDLNTPSGSIVSLTIKDNYFEKNGDIYIDLGGMYYYGVNIEDNYFAVTETNDPTYAIKANVRNMSWNVSNNTLATTNNAAVLLHLDNNGNDAMVQFDGNYITGSQGSLTDAREHVLNIYRTSGVVKYPDVATSRITDANYPWQLSASGSCVITTEDNVSNIPETSGVLYWITSMPESTGAIEIFSSSTTKAAYVREMRNNTWSGWRFLGGPLTWWASGVKSQDTINLPAPAPENSVLIFTPRYTSGADNARFFPTNIISKGATTARFYCLNTDGTESATPQQGVFMLVPYNY